MSVTERVMAAGSWDISLIKETPRTLLESINVERAAFAQLVILPAWVDLRQYSDATMLNLARWSGIYRRQEGDLHLSGAGSSILLGDEDGKGDIFEGSRSTTNGWLSQWIPTVTPISLHVGTITSPGGSYRRSFEYVTAKEALKDLCEYFGVEWRITPSFRLDVGPADTLYGTDPKVIVLRGAGDGGKDSGLTGVTAGSEWRVDSEDYTTKAVYLSEDAGGNTVLTTASLTEEEIPYGRPSDGAPVVLDRLIEAYDDDGTTPQQMANMQLGRFTSLHREISVDGVGSTVSDLLPVGANVWLYNPPYLMDLNNPVYFRGQWTYPIKTRVQGITWPIRAGLGVYMRFWRGPNPNPVWYDLTPFVQWEEAEVDMEVDSVIRDTQVGTNTKKGRR